MSVYHHHSIGYPVLGHVPNTHVWSTPSVNLKNDDMCLVASSLSLKISCSCAILYVLLPRVEIFWLIVCLPILVKRTTGNESRGKSCHHFPFLQSVRAYFFACGNGRDMSNGNTMTSIVEKLHIGANYANHCDTTLILPLTYHHHSLLLTHLDRSSQSLSHCWNDG